MDCLGVPFCDLPETLAQDLIELRSVVGTAQERRRKADDKKTSK